MSTHTVIYNVDLIKHLRSTKEEVRASKIDPSGTAVVIMSLLHNDVDIRANLLVKPLHGDNPMEMLVDFPLKTYMSLSHKVIDEDAIN